MFLLFTSTSDVEKIGLQLSLESVQSHLLASVEQQEDCSTEMVSLHVPSPVTSSLGPSPSPLKHRQVYSNVLSTPATGTFIIYTK